MITKKQERTNWGNNTKTFPVVCTPNNYKEISKIINGKKNVTKYYQFLIIY